MTPEHGLGLDGLLRARASSVVGIVNGIDAREWDPVTDPRIPFRYGIDDLSGKERCKRHLLESLGLSHDPSAPLIGVVSRLTAQKGFELGFEVLPSLLDREEVRLVALGTGSRRLEEFFASLQARFPAKARFLNAYSEESAHRIEAGADLFLMPSLFEPCGLNQMYSQRYGAIPIVHRTGGLADTVESWNPRTGEGTGFLFEHHTPTGLAWALATAIAAWRDPAARARLIRNGMSRDFSWDRQVRRYLDLYGALLTR
jgi:starch synthase